jgi:charged multivesicular body protein 5
MFEDMNEINDIMGRSYGINEDVTDEDLEAELACLEDELEGE